MTGLKPDVKLCQAGKTWKEVINDITCKAPTSTKKKLTTLSSAQSQGLCHTVSLFGFRLLFSNIRDIQEIELKQPWTKESLALYKIFKSTSFEAKLTKKEIEKVI